MKLPRSFDRVLVLITAFLMAFTISSMISTNARRTYAADENGIYEETEEHFVSFYDEGEKLTVRTNAATVGEALERAGIQLALTDIVDPGLTDFYHIPDYNSSYFKVNNLDNLDPSYSLEILEGYLKGRKDNIDFNNERGYSLNIKANLRDVSDKVILAKGDQASGNFYFKLKEEGNSIVFEHSLGNDVVSLSYQIPEDETSNFVNYPVTFTFVIDSESSPTLSLYKDNILLDSKQVGSRSSLDASQYYLLNTLLEEDKSPEEKIVQDIVGIGGTLTPEDIYFINTILNTNS